MIVNPKNWPLLNVGHIPPSTLWVIDVNHLDVVIFSHENSFYIVLLGYSKLSLSLLLVLHATPDEKKKNML